MTDEQESKKRKRPAIGGISQYATIGGKRSSTEHQDVQTLERSDVQTLEHSDVSTTERQNAQASSISDVQTLGRSDAQTLKRSDVSTTERQNAQASSISDVQEKSKPDRNRQTVYLETDLDDWIREYIIRERKRLGHRVEISDIVNEAVRRFMESTSS